MTFYLQINNMEERIPIRGVAESVNYKPENDSESVGITYAVDFNVKEGSDFQSIMTLIQVYFYENTIDELKVYNENNNIIYQSDRYTKLDGEYLYINEDGMQSFTIHVQKTVE